MLDLFEYYPAELYAVVLLGGGVVDSGNSDGLMVCVCWCCCEDMGLIICVCKLLMIIFVICYRLYDLLLLYSLDNTNKILLYLLRQLTYSCKELAIVYQLIITDHIINIIVVVVLFIII